jgi:hypothetical protein
MSAFLLGDVQKKAKQRGRAKRREEYFRIFSSYHRQRTFKLRARAEADENGTQRRKSHSDYFHWNEKNVF